MIEYDLAAVILWKWNRPHTRRGQTVEIEGIGIVPWAEIEAAHREWLALEKPRLDALIDLAATDYRMARPVEDLIDVLVASGSVEYASLPEPVRDLIELRRSLRAVVQQSS